jgi:hypothetical protein
MLNLRRNRRYALLMQYRQFGGRGSNVEPAWATGIAHFGSGVIVDGVVIHIVNDRGIHIVHGTVVVEGVSVPVATLIAATDITEAVIYATIESDVRAPVAMVPSIASAKERPIRRRPERADVGSNDPCSRNPVIAGGGVCPGTGCP